MMMLMIVVIAPFAPLIKEHPMITWPEILREVEQGADGFLTGAATVKNTGRSRFSVRERCTTRTDVEPT
jgi:hypothetical protein